LKTSKFYDIIFISNEKAKALKTETLIQFLVVLFKVRIESGKEKSRSF
jgi:hypothetical protein